MRFPAGIILSLALTIAALAGAAAQTSAPTATATFAGGCFWCTESDFDKVKGVDQHDLGLYRRHGGQSDLRTGGHRPHRPYRGGRSRLRPGGGELRAAARRVLEERRSARQGPPVLRPRQPVSSRRSSITTRSSARSPRRPRRRIRRASSSRSRPRSPRRRRSTRPRTITRTTTRRIRRAISSTASIADATPGSKSCGANRDRDHARRGAT